MVLFGEKGFDDLLIQGILKEYLIAKIIKSIMCTTVLKKGYKNLYSLWSFLVSVLFLNQFCCDKCSKQGLSGDV